MSVTKKLVTHKFNVDNAKRFTEDVVSETNNFFVYVAKHTPYENGDDQIDDPSQSVKSTVIDVYNNMVFSKKVANTDVIHMIPRYNWTANTVYDQYEHTDGELKDKEFYIITDDTNEYNVFKCLSNNLGANSVVAPLRVGSNADLQSIITGDGYVWKYMYTISQNQWDKFATTKYAPVTANTTVIAGAVAGQIEVIKIVDGGTGYNNYYSNGIFRTGDIKVSGSDTTYGSPEDSSIVDNFFRGCVLKVTSGAGIDQYRRIIDYDGASVKKTFTLDSPFTTVPSVGDTYDVFPYIYVFGDGSETTPAEALAVIDPDQSNSVIEIEILSTGAGYRSALAYVGLSPDVIPITQTSNLVELHPVVSGGVGFTEANLEVIIPPAGGHGSDPWNELFANRVCVYSKFSNSESGTIPTTNDFRQVGIIVNPLFNNLDIFLSANDSVGTFSVGETVALFKNIRLAGDIVVTATSANIGKLDAGKISPTITISNTGIGYNSATNNELVISAPSYGGTTATATFTNNGTGEITAIVVTNQGSNYDEAPTVTVALGAGGSNGYLIASLANPQETLFEDAFEISDYVLIETTNQNWISTVVARNDEVIQSSANSPFSSSAATVSAIKQIANGVVTSVSLNQITLSNVHGTFVEGGRVIGLSTGAVSKIKTSNNTFNALELNDKDPNGFTTTIQLTRLLGNFEAGNTFISDEQITQQGLIAYTNPIGKLHTAEINAGINDDVLYISNEYGIYNLDPNNNRPITGDSSDAVLTYLSARYPGDFVKDSGQVFYYENLDPITRVGNKSEVVKIIMEF